MNRILEVNIEKIVTGGKGMGRVDGKVVFAERCAVGDTVSIQVITEKKSYVNGEVIGIVKESPDRVTPECKYFDQCGGCDFWHVGYETELKYKKLLFLETLKKIGRIELNDVKIHASPSYKHYRNRVQFKVRNVNGDVLLGFYKKGSRHVIDIDKCLITNEKINEQILSAKSLLKELPFSENIPQVDFTIDDADKKIFMIIHVISDDFGSVRASIAEKFKDFFTEDVIPFIQMGRKSTTKPVFPESADETVSYRITSATRDFDYRLSLSPGSFLQVNYPQNLRLIETVLNYLDLTKDDSVLDLFSGAGNFSFAASHFCKDVIGIESYEPAVRDAKRNLAQLKIGNVKFICSDVDAELEKMMGSRLAFDNMIIDPPRTGAISALKKISKLIKKKIAYVSCDMATFSRDIAFLQSAGFTLNEICLVDMFPRTHHVEISAGFKI